MVHAMTPIRSRTLARARIEIIPLIDVIFFLLATFVLFTLSLNRISNIEVTLPVTRPLGSIVPDESLTTVTVTANGALSWNGAPIAPSELAGRFEYLRETHADPRVLIGGDVHARYGSAVAVLDAARGAGIRTVSFETRARPAEASR